MFKIPRPSYLQNRTTALRYLVSSRIHGASRPYPLLMPDSPMAAQKAGKRGGQDLTNRDLRLSKFIKQKQAFSRAGKPKKQAVDPPLTKNEPLAQGGGATHGPSKPSVKTFRGTAIPQKPKPPESDGSFVIGFCWDSQVAYNQFIECCMSGKCYV